MAEPSHPKSKRPSDSAFKQQRLPAWQPILTAGTVLPTFFIVGITFIPIGIGLLYFSDQVGEKVIDYTYCTSVESPNMTCADLVTTNGSIAINGSTTTNGSTMTNSSTTKNSSTSKNSSTTTNSSTATNSTNSTCTCSIQFYLDTPLEGTVYMYYGLRNFYQNHRRYVKSRDDFQLLGQLSSSPSTDCDPFRLAEDGKPIAPCGAIANSLFSDELKLTANDMREEVPLLRTGIAWPSDKEDKFKNPPVPSGKELKDVFKDFVKPKMWKKNVWELDTENPDNNGFQNEDLIVWMRTAALPNFRKLYRRIDHSVEGFTKGLPRGNYTLNVTYNYPVVGFEGSKQMILTTTSILGGKNPFIGWAYIAVGCICFVLGIVFLIIHIKYGKSTTEVINVIPHSSYQ